MSLGRKEILRNYIMKGMHSVSVSFPLKLRVINANSARDNYTEEFEFEKLRFCKVEPENPEHGDVFFHFYQSNYEDMALCVYCENSWRVITDRMNK